MRIAGGEGKGTRLHYPRAGLRPTQQKVRQAIVNMLRSRIVGARVADLFCGAGALGIEALSAGAGSVLFVERDRRTLACLRQNVAQFGDRAEIRARDAAKLLPGLAGAGFDVILADPPYEQGLDQLTLDGVARYNLLCCGGLLVLEHSRRDLPKAPPELALLKSRAFGDTVVSVFERPEPGAGNSGAARNHR